MDKYNLGVDVDHNWISDGVGGLGLVEYEENVAQAVFNRLSCSLGNLSWVYSDYGSNLKEFLGKTNDEITRQDILSECQEQVVKDPRLSDAEVEIAYFTSVTIGLKITGTITGTHEDFEEYFIFGAEENYMSNATHQNDAYYDTYIKTRRKGYAARPGDTIGIHCHVLKKSTNTLVPIGQVSCNIESASMGACEVQQSWGAEPGTATFELKIPRYFTYGIHTMQFKYSGAKGYNNCTKIVPLIVAQKLPTVTQHNHTKGNRFTDNDKVLWFDTYEASDPNSKRYWEMTNEEYAQREEELAEQGLTITEGAVRVRDWNGFPVGWDYENNEPAGVVKLYLEKTLSDRLPTKIFMKDDDDSYSLEQPYLLEDCIVRDIYDRPVMSGNIELQFKIYVYNGANVMNASHDTYNLTFTIHDEIRQGKNYRLEDTEGNLVDVLKAHVQEDLVYFYSVNETAEYRITIN